MCGIWVFKLSCVEFGKVGEVWFIVGFFYDLVCVFVGKGWVWSYVDDDLFVLVDVVEFVREEVLVLIMWKEWRKEKGLYGGCGVRCCIDCDFDLVFYGDYRWRVNMLC